MAFQLSGCGFLASRGREGVLRISSDRDERRIFLGLKVSILGFLGGLEILARIFFG